MLGWFRKKNIQPEETDAYKLGQSAAVAAAANLDKIMEERFQPAFDSFLSVLRNCIQKSFNREDAPPLTLARIEYESFLENVSEMKPKMTDEISAYMSEWLRLSEEAGVRGPIDELISTRVNQFTSDLTMAGLKLVTDYASALKDADDHWRKANPKKATQFPRD